MRKADRARRIHGACAEAATWVDQIVERLKENLLLDDVRVAEARAATGASRGCSRRLIGQKLRRQGVAADVVTSSTAAINDEASAIEYSRRRKLTSKGRQKALAALARQGFPFDVARRALDRALEEDA